MNQGDTKMGTNARNSTERQFHYPQLVRFMEVNRLEVIYFESWKQANDFCRRFREPVPDKEGDER